MTRKIITGCCGWSYLRPAQFEERLKKAGGSLLEAYAQLLSAVEVNSTFYRIPMISTAQKWRAEASSVDKDFVFTVKAYQGITHVRRFGKGSLEFYDATRDIAEALHAPLVLFQTPASFHPTPDSVSRITSFFSDIERKNLTLAWEARGRWLENPEALLRVCEEADVIHCVDPFRDPSVFFGSRGWAYFRLHGFGQPSMYRYDFSGQELRALASQIQALPDHVRNVYVLFNNVNCYQNALDFEELLTRTNAGGAS